MKNNKKKTKPSHPFYTKWWFWLIVGALFIITWLFILINDINLRTSIIGICGIWGSSIATIFIGIIAVKQNNRFEFRAKKENLIKEIRQEERMFLEDCSKTLDLQKYYDILFAAMLYDDKFENIQKQIFLRLSILGQLKQFEKNLELLNYCNVSIKQFTEAFCEFTRFVDEKLLNSEKIMVSDKPAKKFKSYYVELSKELNNNFMIVNQYKNTVIFEMQFLINQIQSCNTDKKFSKLETIIQTESKKQIEKSLNAVESQISDAK